MAAGHTHADETGREETHRLLCEMFSPDTDPARRAEIRSLLADCPECAQRVESERAVREMVRSCCGGARAPEPLRQRIITTISYTEIRYR